MTSTIFSDKSNSKREFFTVLRWQLRKCLPLTLLYAAVEMIFGCWPPHHFVSDNLIAMTVPIIAFSAIAPLLLLGECFSRRQADTMYALPVSRGSWYLTALLAGLISLWAPLVLSLSTRQLLCIPDTGLHLGALGFFSISLMLLGAAVFLFFCLIAAGSGGLLSYAVNTFLLSVCWPIGIACFLVLMSHTLPVGSLPGLLEKSLIQVLSPPVALFQSGISKPLIWELVYWALAAVALALGGRALYRRRGSETTGTFSTRKPLELAVRTEAALLAAAFLGQAVESMSTTDWIPEVELEGGYVSGNGFFGTFGIPLVLGSIALALLFAWLFTELLYHRSVGRLKKHLPALLVPLAVTVCALGVVSTGLGLDMPTEMEAVNAVRLEGEFFGRNDFHTYSMLAETGEVSREDLSSAACYRFEAEAYSPELLEKVKNLQEKWIALERANQYPYLPGRRAYERRNGFALTLYGTRDISTWNCSYQGRHTEETDALYEECAALANELATSEELISGMLPVCAIDALSGIEKIKLDPAAEQKETELHGYQNMEATYTRLSYETRKPGENPVRVSSLPKNFPEKLEAALRSDLKHERLPTWKDFNRLEEEKGVQQVYELRYAYGAPFTARGGVLDHAEPAKGKELRLYSEYAEAWVLRIWPQMTETYALLESTLAK